MAIYFTESEARAKKAIAVLIPHSSRFYFQFSDLGYLHYLQSLERKSNV
jgi:hypothetical protein